MDILVAKKLGFLVIGVWSLTAIHLLARFDPHLAPKPFRSLGPPLGGKFDVVRGLRVTGRYGMGIKAIFCLHRVSAT